MMKVLPIKAHAPIAGVCMVITMVLLMPALAILNQSGVVPGFAGIWWKQVVGIAPYAIPLGLILGTIFNILVGLFVRPVQMTR